VLKIALSPISLLLSLAPDNEREIIERWVRERQPVFEAKIKKIRIGRTLGDSQSK
jgi:hypothetical protein